MGGGGPRILVRRCQPLVNWLSKLVESDKLHHGLPNPGSSLKNACH